MTDVRLQQQWDLEQRRKAISILDTHPRLADLDDWITRWWERWESACHVDRDTSWPGEAIEELRASRPLEDEAVSARDVSRFARRRLAQDAPWRRRACFRSLAGYLVTDATTARNAWTEFVAQHGLRQAINDARAGTRSAEPRMVDLPIFGSVDPSRLSFPLFTVLIGLADGINPCAFYVLIVLLGLLLHVRSRKRVALYGAVFVVASGVVYFAFMTAWLGVFLAIGGSRRITLVLGVVLVVLYNVVYVLPLGVIVSAYVLAMKRVAMTERRAKILKAVSGTLLLVFGVVFLAASQLLR